jgi:hypothetical protein
MLKSALEIPTSMGRVGFVTTTGSFMAVATQNSNRFSERENIRPDRQPYYNPHTSIGATSHWIRTAGMLAPLLIGELVEDPTKKWRWIRIASVTTALVSEAMYTHKIRQEREERAAHCQAMQR